MRSEYEALCGAIRLEVIKYDGTNSLDVAGTIVALIAERTKEATPEMIEAGRKAFQWPGYGPRVAQEFSAMHAASALCPPRDKKDAEG